MKTLREYSAYLRRELLDDLASENMRLAISMKIPLVELIMKSMGDAWATGLLERTKKSLSDFLLSLEEGTALDKAKESIKRWEEDKLTDIRKQDVHPSDLILIYACQKKAIYKFLPRFTERSDEATAIIEELEDFYSKVQNDGVQLLFKIQKQTDRALKEREEQLQAIFSNAPDAIVASNMNAVITEWNKAAEKMYGYTRSEAIGKKVDEFVAARYLLPATPAGINGQVAQNGSWGGEFIQAVRDGRKINVLSSITYLRNEEGKPIGYLYINRDITEMRKIEAELREIEKRYHLLVDAVEDYAIITLDTEGNIITWNKGAEKINGYSEQETLGRHFSMLYTAEDRKHGLPQKNLLQALNEKKYSFSGWRARKDKSLFWADGVITELLDDEGNPKGYVKITKDMSDKRRVEEEIIRKTEELKRSNEDLEQFAYVASHDLQEPLRMVTSYVQLLSKRYRDKLDGDALEFIDFAVGAANRMRTLIHSLLKYSRINQEKQQVYVDLNETVTEVIKDLSIVIHENQVKISRERLPQVYGDPVLLGQLFFNLLSNAIKFRSANPPEISISVKRIKDEYVFTVKDNGIGLKKEYCKKIFVIFQRLHTVDKYPGTGIGLAICRKIVERHGGRIWVESEPGKGSSFYFTIKSVVK